MTPALSVVATSRDDDHGGNLLPRMQLFVDGLAEQAERFATQVELIVVEWNPPPGRPPLMESLEWRRSDRFCPRIITVPPAVHRSLPNSERIALFQMIGKNAGIRRAAAPFVLATNVDILLSDELFARLAGGLEANAMYRVDRRDVVAALDGPVLPTPAECRALPAIREHGLDGLRVPGPREARTSRGPARSAAQLAESAWYRLVLPRLHTSGCGDFTLASRDAWFAMRGYPEWPIFSWHVDGMVLFQAYAAGMKMLNLTPPMIAIHLEHGHGSGWTPEGATTLFERLDRSGVPYLTTSEYRRRARAVLRAGRAAQPFNGPDWGLVSAGLEVVSP